MNHIDLLYILSIVFNFLLVLGLVFIIRKLALRFNIVDKPNLKRKIHQSATPFLGGLGVYIGTSITIFLMYYFQLADFSLIPLRYIIGIFLAGLVIMIVGLLDDKYRLKPAYQLLGPVLAAIIVIWVGIRIGYVTNPLGGVSNALIYLGEAVAIVLTFVWLLGMMYTTKFLDGLDGLDGGITMIAGLIIFFVSLDWDIPFSATGIWALIFSAGMMAFLLLNWHPAKMFLGEGGSIWIGFMIGVLSIISGSKIATTLLVMGIPALDVLWVVAQRLMKKQSPFSHADSKHMHYQLMKIGFSHRGTVLFLWLIALGFGMISVFVGGIGKLVGLIILFLVMVFLAMITYFKYGRSAN